MAFMELQFTAVFRQVPEGYIGFVEELRGANRQGATLEEARANLQEAVAMVLDAKPRVGPTSDRKGAGHPRNTQGQCVNEDVQRPRRSRTVVVGD